MALKEEPVSFKQWVAVFGAILGAFMAVLDIQITNASIKEITGGLGATLDEASWISTAYLVAEIIVIPLSGFFTRLLSLRTYLTITSILFLIFSVGCAMSWNLGSMIFFRAFQGFFGGALIPLAFQVILSLPPSKKTMGMALFTVTATFAPAIGPTIGGYLTEQFNWSVIFYMNLIPGALLMIAIYFGIEKEKPDYSLLKGLDIYGILSMAVGLSCLTIFLEEGQRKDWFGSSEITWLAVIAFIFIVIFLYIELTSKAPFINLRLLMQKNFGFGCLVNFIVGLALYGALFLLPLFLSTIPMYNSIRIGETMMWSGLPQLLIIPFVPKILARVDSRWVAFAGINIFALSCFMNSSLTSEYGYDQLMWSQIVRAIGQPMLMIPLSTITTGLIAREQIGSASGLFNMLRNLGGSVGIALLSTMVTLREQFHSAKIGEGVTIFSHWTRARLQGAAIPFLADGGDVVTSKMKGLLVVDNVVRRQANVMSFNDCFLIVAAALALSSVLILLCDKVGGAPAEGAH